MTGKELIIYILENNLENEPVFKDGKFIGLMTLSEAAIKFNVGTATVKAWYMLGLLKGITIGGVVLLYANQVNPVLIEQTVDEIIV